MAVDFNQVDLTQRIVGLIDESCMTNRKFAISAGIDPSGFHKKMLGQLQWTVNDINKISENMGIRRGWLLDGEGQVFKAPDEILDQIPAMPTRTYDTRTGVPYFDVDFELGFDQMENDQTTKPDYMIDFMPYNKCDAWCNVRGSSMMPTISSGDIIALKEVKDFHILVSGEIYGVVTTNSLRTIKRVRDNGSTITLIPDNKDYPEQTISKTDILRVYQVVGSMKMF